MFKKIRWPWWNTTGTTQYRSRIAQLRAKRAELEPSLNLELPRVTSEEENEILTKELPMPTLPSATGEKDDNSNQKMIWGIIAGIVLLAGIITTVVIVKKRKEGE